MEETSDHAGVPLSRLLAHREWVARVAHALASGAAADDLEQRVWLRAIERPPRHAGGLRGWLATLLRHAARDAAREAERRRAREARVATGETAIGADLLAEAEAHRRVVDVVMDLAEPYRTTILLRYYEDLGPTEIARRQGVPVETVRTRLKRAHARLAERLEEGAHPEDRRNLLRTLAPLLLARTPGKGLVLMTTKAKVLIGAAALLLFATATVLLLPNSTPSDRLPSRKASLPSPPPNPSRRNAAGPAVSKATETEPWPAKGIDVHVVDARERPLRHVVVYYREAPAWPGWKKVMAGRRFLTDEGGRVRVPVPHFCAFIGAHTDGRAGRMQVTYFAASPLILHVLPEKWVRVKVRVDDDAGRPAAGVTLVLCRIDGEGRLNEVARVETGAQGRALLEVEDRQIRHIEGLPALDVDVVISQRKPIRKKVTKAVLGGEEMRFELPPTGSVRVHVLAPDGSPAKPPVRARIYAPHRKPGLMGKPEAAKALSMDGTAFFPRVACADRIFVMASDPEGRLFGPGVTVDAPARGKTIDVTVKTEWNSPRVTGRIVDDRGQPVVNARFFAEMQKKDRWDMAFGLDTDGAGRFALTFRSPLRAPTTVRAFPRDGSPARVGVFHLVPPLPKEGLDVGNIQLESAPLLVAGVVVDPAGHPVAGVDVRAAADAPYMIVGRRCRTGPDGSFALYGNWMKPTLEVYVDSFDWQRKRRSPLVVPVGSTGTRIVCRRRSRLDIALDLDPRFERAKFDFRIVSPGDHRRWLALTRWRDSRHAVITTDATEPFDLEVLGARDGPVLTTLDGISVEPGRTTEREIDLRGKLTVYVFRLTDGKSGISPWGDQVRLLDQSQANPHALSPDPDGFFRFVATVPEVNLSIGVKGYRPLVRKVTPADREIALTKVFRVEFHLDPTAARPDEDLVLVPVLTPLDGPSAGQKLPRGTRFGKREYWNPRGDLPRAGRYRVTYLLSRAGGKDPEVALTGAEPSEIDVKDRTMTQGFTVRITASDLDAARALLR